MGRRLRFLFHLGLEYKLRNNFCGNAHGSFNILKITQLNNFESAYRSTKQFIAYEEFRVYKQIFAYKQFSAYSHVYLITSRVVRLLIKVSSSDHGLESVRRL